MSYSITDEDRKQIEKFLENPRGKRNPDDLLPAEDNETDDSGKPPGPT